MAHSRCEVAHSRREVASSTLRATVRSHQVSGNTQRGDPDGHHRRNCPGRSNTIQHTQHTQHTPSEADSPAARDRNGDRRRRRRGVDRGRRQLWPNTGRTRRPCRHHAPATTSSATSSHAGSSPPRPSTTEPTSPAQRTHRHHAPATTSSATSSHAESSPSPPSTTEPRSPADHSDPHHAPATTSSATSSTRTRPRRQYPDHQRITRTVIARVVVGLKSHLSCMIQTQATL